MATYIPYINPVRIVKDSLIDYSNTFVEFDLTTQREKYQRGITPSDVYVDYIVNKQINWIIYSDVAPSNIYMELPNGSNQSITPINITPSGWASEDIYKITFNFTQQGLHRLNFQILTIYRSDYINVKNASTYKDLIEFLYWDVQNRYQGFFYDSSIERSYVWLPRAYYTGIIRPLMPEVEQSIYKDDPGNSLILETTSSREVELILTDIHHTYIDVINQQRKCDNFYVNGIKFSCLDMSSEPVDAKTDLVNITMRLQETENDGFFNY